MKLKLLFLFGLSISGFIVLTSTSAGRAAGANQGNTGAPGDNNRTCITCHNSGPISVDLKLALIDEFGTEVSSYKAGQTYTVRVRINDVGTTPPSGWGFQMVCLNAPLDQDGEDLENWVDMGMNNYKIASARGRSYVEHAGVSSENLFEVEWTAPAANTGTVSFYASGNGVNFNGGTSGDGADADKIEITEDISSSVSETWTQTTSIVPNPAFDEVRVSWGEGFSGQLRLLNVVGQKITQWNIHDQKDLTMSVQNLKSGLYLMQFSHEDGTSKTLRLIRK